MLVRGCPTIARTIATPRSFARDLDHVPGGICPAQLLHNILLRHIYDLDYIDRDLPDM